MDKVVKTFETKIEDGWWIASTPDVDRSQDIVEPLGLQLDNYRRNPVLVWAHDYQSPFAVIGRAAGIALDQDGLRIQPEWREPVNDNDPMTIIRALIDGGLVRALSIGFRPLEWHENQHGGMTFTKAEVLEISAVPIPANQAAVRAALAYAAKSIGAPPSVGAQPAPSPEAEAVGETAEPDTPASDAPDASQGQEPEAALAGAAALAEDELAPEEEEALVEAVAAFLEIIVAELREEL